MRASCLIVFIQVLLVTSAWAQQSKDASQPQAENVILVSMDGLRWQELFGGADLRLMNEEAGDVKDVPALKKRFYRGEAVDRRQLLMPFFWSSFAKQGQVFGDPSQGSSVKCTNGQFFSYPGYNELLVGFGDPKITSNDKNYNQNTTVLEWLNNTPKYKGSVAAFASWDVFPYIINDRRSGIEVNAGWQPLKHASNQAALEEINKSAEGMPKYWDNVRYDYFTYRGAIEYMKLKKPRVLYVSLGETDDWAHAGRYDLYLDSARRNDDYIRELWETAQAMPQYAGKTTLILTTDHGRGDSREGWKSHGITIPGSDVMWVAVMGPNVEAKGVLSGATATQSQVAATVAQALGEDFTAHDPRVADPLDVFLAPR